MADYLRLARIFVNLGIEKVRLTGGEPLLRKGLIELIRELAKLRTHLSGDPLDLAVTTNGHLLEDQAARLKAAGLSRITVSMDAVDAGTFARITRVPDSFEKVQRGIHAAQEAGLGPVKVNCVVLRGFNDDQIVPFAKFSREYGVIVRFIEFMPLEEDRLWTPEKVVPFSEVVARLEQFRPLVKLPANSSGETAVRYTFDDGLGEIGVIAPVSRAFCGQCSRIRLTSDGKIRTCLFSQFDHDLYGVMLRGGADEELAAFIEKTVSQKEARHHIGEPGFLKPSRSMVHIGGDRAPRCSLRSSPLPAILWKLRNCKNQLG
jgi:cyclic pyranopterin phosphate synthase